MYRNKKMTILSLVSLSTDMAGLGRRGCEGWVEQPTNLDQVIARYLWLHFSGKEEGKGKDTRIHYSYISLAC